MKYIILLLICVGTLFSESYDDHIFPVRLTIDSASDLKFTFDWAADTNSLRYNISRKELNDSSFGRPIVLPGDATSYIDSTVKPGIHYEYKIENYQTEISAFNYISAGVDLPINKKSSILILVADNTTLPQNFDRYKELLQTEMKAVYVKEVQASLDFNKEKILSVKNLIRETRNKDNELKYVLLIGNVPIPYSGNYSPDGHTEHIGAWPADVWYAELDGVWTDSIIDADSAAAQRQHNIPNDGKFDNYYLPSPSELIIARIDFRNLSAFTESEDELLERYFNKNIRYRTAEYQPKEKAFISDGFREYGGYPATFLYNQFASLFGSSQITLKNMRDSMSSGNYSMAYACAPGGYNSVFLTLYTEELAQKPYDAVFLCCFGSWLADWDSENNLLRGAIASQPSILCSWFGNRPQVPLHNLGLGNTIGEQIYVAQNNKMLYEYWYNAVSRGVHLNLMGDPTLKLRHVAMPSNLESSVEQSSFNFKWTASDNAEYYNLYVSNESGMLGDLVNQSPILGTTYKVNILRSGKSYYTLKAVQKVITKNGSYYEESSGIRDSLEYYPPEDILVYMTNPIIAEADFEISVSLKTDDYLDYNIYDLQGSLVESGSGQQKALNHNIQIKSTFISGTYFLSLRTASGIEKSHKFTVIR